MVQKSKYTSYLVTIDGPAASGKSTVSRQIAAQFGWEWVSTGAFYRGLAYVAQRLGVVLDDERALAELAESDRWSVQLGADKTRVFLGKEDVSSAIYGEDVGAYASKVSQYPLVRSSLLEAQRQCAVGVRGLVAEGRDCGTVVFPQAPVKIYLTAHQESRAQRRAEEKGESLGATLEAQVQRDAQDSQRQAAPLQVPAGATVVDTSELTLEQVVAADRRQLDPE